MAPRTRGGKTPTCNRGEKMSTIGRIVTRSQRNVVFVEGRREEEEVEKETEEVDLEEDSDGEEEDSEEESEGEDDEEVEKEKEKEKDKEKDKEKEKEGKEDDDEDDDEDDVEDDEEDDEEETEQPHATTTEAPNASTSAPPNAPPHCPPDCPPDVPMADAVNDDTFPEADSGVLKPVKFYFDEGQYTRVCKMGSRCHVKDTVEMLKNDHDVSHYFTSHPQFRHLFHMPQEANRKPMGMWMLMLHLALIESHDALWFVVNGVPIRYSIREHGLLCGLDCHEYPSDYSVLRDKDRGDFKFADRIFQDRKKVKISDVKEKMESMTACSDKTKLSVLYFLCKVLKAKSKMETAIEPFLLKIVDNLKVCRTFPWGRLTFDDLLTEVRTIPLKFKHGIVTPKKSWTFSGFILPLEAFAFECIPALGAKYRLDVEAEKDCPRLCKKRFVESSMKGYPLDEINKEIGTSKDIISIIKPDWYENDLMDRIMDPVNDPTEGILDAMVRGWTKELLVWGGTICWDDLYEKDVAARAAKVGTGAEGGEAVSDGATGGFVQMMEQIAGRLSELSARVDENFESILHRLDDHSVRLLDCEKLLKEERI